MVLTSKSRKSSKKCKYSRSSQKPALTFIVITIGSLTARKLGPTEPWSSAIRSRSKGNFVSPSRFRTERRAGTRPESAWTRKKSGRRRWRFSFSIEASVRVLTHFCTQTGSSSLATQTTSKEISSLSTTNLARKPEKRFVIWTRNRY